MDIDPQMAQMVAAYIEATKDKYESRFDEPHAFASDALDCSRKIGFRIAEIPASNPIDTTGEFAMAIGRYIHDMAQGALIMRDRRWKAEQEWGLLDRVSGRGDVYHTGSNIVGEIKSMAPYAYDLAVTGVRKGLPEGVKAEHRIQALINAIGLDSEEMPVDTIEVRYVNKAATQGKTVFATHTEPFNIGNRAEADVEMKRLRSIVETVEEGTLPKRNFQGKDVTNPLDMKNWKWPCGYCRYQTLCGKLPTGRVEVSQSDELQAAMIYGQEEQTDAD